MTCKRATVAKIVASLLSLVATGIVLLTIPALAQNANPVTTDGIPDKAHPAHIVQIEAPSHGATLFGVFYAAAGAGPHSTVLLLHGFPGYEQNMDLAQAIRRAGWNVLTFHYRGAWGSHGDFSFAHAIEDSAAMLAYLRNPANTTRLGIDPARIIVIGHSMGGFMAAYTAAHDAKLAGLVTISAWNIGAEAARTSPQQEQPVIARYHQNTGPLTGCTAETLWTEAQRNGTQWDYVKFAPRITAFPVLVVESDDRHLQDSRALVAALKQSGNPRVSELHLPTDHVYSDHRIALATAIIQWLGQLPH
jgi:pimeloyl-ACP methyl ester carboxylesterase